MPSSVPARSLLRATLVFAALLGAALPNARAAGRNHDLQFIRIPAAPLDAHDRAPCPGFH